MADPDTLSHIEKVTGVSIARLADLEKALGRAVENAMQQASRISPDGLAAIKCALAYSRSLAFEKVTRPDVERAFEAIFSRSDLGRQEQSTYKALQDYLMRRLVEQCAEHHLAMQVHTGMQAAKRYHVRWTDPSLLVDLVKEYQ